MPFDIRVIRDEDARAPFVFTGTDGGDYKLPHIADLTLDQQDQIDRGFILPVLREVADPDTVTQVKGYRRAQTIALLAAWQAHAGQEPGEPDASSR